NRAETQREQRSTDPGVLSMGRKSKCKEGSGLALWHTPRNHCTGVCVPPSGPLSGTGLLQASDQLTHTTSQLHVSYVVYISQAVCAHASMCESPLYMVQVNPCPHMALGASHSRTLMKRQLTDHIALAGGRHNI
ncbi:hypothetical protein CHARACLAT_029173, partial [Characodon lateralis]|nr:hypothetical protein [Characodon lateralis]